MDRRILVTRPAAQASGLIQLINSAGGSAVALPTLDTRPLAPDAASQTALSNLSEYDLAIFISANAVHHAQAFAWPWPAALPAYAVGAATATALQSSEVAQVCAPDDGTDSEALLRMPALRNVQGKRIVIFRGVGGRELLAQGLISRGARVDYVQCYERFVPPVDPAPAIDWCQRRMLHAVCISSAQGLENLIQMTGQAGWECLRELPHFCIHPRISTRARALGVTNTVTCGASDAQVVAALITYFNPMRH